MSDDLLPCPFCRGTDLDPLANCVVCLDCGARGPTQEQIEILCDPNLAKEQWNRRAIPATDAREAALREAANHISELLAPKRDENADYNTGVSVAYDAILALIGERT